MQHSARWTSFVRGTSNKSSVFTLMRLGEPERPCGNQSLNTCYARHHYRSPSHFHHGTRTRSSIPPEADAILSSLDNTLYRLSSPVLRRTTTFASPSFTFEPPSKPIPIHEYDTVLEWLLRILSGVAIPRWRTFDDLEGVPGLAETWGAKRAVDSVRDLLVLDW
ncbi:hypothetical protein IW261DRAFT_1113809 [Armillaria novae-zelandiae]|uniref:Uncharacterized protein n=1 Tax=Armillaria novae-zelandiae TaxID=153914 RepID=A0AA39NJ54_9AGAR|nr:hypothetical protein IW261DRAFT_1113809 [Armillaria novae-zelandiae]